MRFSLQVNANHMVVVSVSVGGIVRPLLIIERYLKMLILSFI